MVTFLYNNKSDTGLIVTLQVHARLHYALQLAVQHLATRKISKLHDTFHITLNIPSEIALHWHHPCRKLFWSAWTLVCSCRKLSTTLAPCLLDPVLFPTQRYQLQDHVCCYKQSIHMYIPADAAVFSQRQNTYLGDHRYYQQPVHKGNTIPTESLNYVIHIRHKTWLSHSVDSAPVLTTQLYYTSHWIWWERTKEWIN